MIMELNNMEIRIEKVDQSSNLSCRIMVSLNIFLSLRSLIDQEDNTCLKGSLVYIK